MSFHRDLIQRGVIDRSDIAIASFLETKGIGESGEKIDFTFFSHSISYSALLASKAYRAGHTALPLSHDRLLVLIKELFDPLDEDHDLLGYIHRCVVDEITAGNWLKWNWKIAPVFDTEYLSLPFSLYDEESLAGDIVRLCAVTDKSTENRFLRVKNSPLYLALNIQQQKATENAINFPFSIISGGPGTGKTHTAGVSIALLIEAYSMRKKASGSAPFAPFKVLVTAPTGKAVFNLNVSIRSALAKYENILQIQNSDFHIEAKTLHKYLLEQRNEKTKSSYHVIIIDECSMIDTKMMSDVFAMTQTGTRLILLGDPYQLPPINPGKPFSDLISMSTSFSTIAHAHLIDCVRTESKEILHLASSVLCGDEQLFSDILEASNSSSPLIHIPIDTQESFFTACRYLEEEIIRDWENVDTIEKGLHVSISKKILTPTKKGSLVSANSLNNAFVHALSLRAKRRETMRYIEPLLITKNRYQLDCMNGDIGIVEKRWNSKLEHMEETIHLAWKKENNSFPAALCPERDLGYAMTVHKSQGSEFSHVFFVTEDRNPLLIRELLYTAITRAKKGLSLIGSKTAFKKAIQSPSKRYTVFPNILKKKNVEMSKSD